MTSDVLPATACLTAAGHTRKRLMDSELCCVNGACEERVIYDAVWSQYPRIVDPSRACLRVCQKSAESLPEPQLTYREDPPLSRFDTVVGRMWGPNGRCTRQAKWKA